MNTYTPLMGQETMMSQQTMMPQNMMMPPKQRDNTLILLLVIAGLLAAAYVFLSTEQGAALVGGDSQSKTGGNSTGNAAGPAPTPVAKHSRSQAVERSKTWIGTVDAGAWADDKTPTVVGGYKVEPAGWVARAFAWPTNTSIETLRQYHAARCTTDQLQKGDLLISTKAKQVIIFDSWVNSTEYNLVYMSPSNRGVVTAKMPYPFLADADGVPYIEGLVPYCIKEGWVKPFELDPSLPIPPTEQEYKDGMAYMPDSQVMFNGDVRPKGLWGSSNYCSVDRAFTPSEGRFDGTGKCRDNEVSLVPGGPCYGRITSGSRNIQYIAVHTTVSSQSNPGSAKMTGHILSYWANKGWSKRGYHFLIRADGRVDNLEPTTEISYGVSGMNTPTINVSFIGGMSTPNCDNRTESQKQSLRRLLKRLQASFPNAKIQGHTEFPGVTKPCPCFPASTEYADLRAEDEKLATYWKKYLENQ